MAELVTKKSTNVVSSKKNDVCSVKSNNGLIDIDNITPSNNHHIKLCDDDEDDLILTNNTKNELNTDDKSLQELIENELALRICNDDNGDDDEDDGEDDDDTNNDNDDPIGCKPEITIKKILLEPRQDLMDINTKFIDGEINNYDIVVDESEFNFTNGQHEAKHDENLKLSVTNDVCNLIDEVEFSNGIETDKCEINEAIDLMSGEFQVKPPTLLDKNFQDYDDDDNIGKNIVKKEEEEEIARASVDIDIKNETEIKKNQYDERQLEVDAWLDPVSLHASQQSGQFSDDFAGHVDDKKSENNIIPEQTGLIDFEENKDDIKIMGTMLADNNNHHEEIQIFVEEAECEALEKEKEIDEIKEIDDKEELELNSEELIENIERPDDSLLPSSPEEPSDSDNNHHNFTNPIEILQDEINSRLDMESGLRIEENNYNGKKINGFELTSNNNPEIVAITVENDEANCSPSIDNGVLDKCLSNTLAIAPLATPDDESISDLSNICAGDDSEIHEEVITTSSTVTSSMSKNSSKTKKKKIEGVAGNDASQISTPRTKKTKKSKKSELEKENISVNGNTEAMSMNRRVSNHKPEELSDEDDLSNVNVKSLTQCYVSETSRGENGKSNKEVIETGVSIKQLCRSFGDISNADEVEKATIGNAKQTMDTQEKAKSMDDLSVYGRTSKIFPTDASVFARVSVTALRASYCSLANLTTSIEREEEKQENNLQKSSFNKFDALSKKSVLHVRSIDATKSQQQLNSLGQNGDANPNCRSCGKVVFQMEQTKAEGLVFHKNCFRCSVCSKQLNVDNYESNECILYCKAHFKELFQPKPVEESDQPVRPRKPEMIIRENEPKELPPDVVRASDKPDLGLEELSSLNVKSRFQVFEKSTADMNNDIERSPSQVAVKRSPSILSKLAKFQAKGMDIGVADESLNGIPYEESSESEEDEDLDDADETDGDIVKSKRSACERPMSFSKMDDIKNRWEVTSQQGRRESQREARKEEMAGIRSRLFMGKQGKMKEMYQQAVATSEKITKTNPVEEIQHSTHARSIKEKFERGETIAASDDEADNKPKAEKPDEEVIAAGISRKSRSLFLELDASAAKTGRPVTPVNPKTPTEAPKRARDVNSPEREIYRDPDVIRADDRVDEVVHTDTARKMLSIFRQMEENASKEDLPDGPKPLKRFTPPPEDKFARPTGSDTEDDEEDGEESADDDSAEEKDPNYVRASDKVEDEFLKQSQNAVKAKTLRAKFEQWETTDGKGTSQHIAEMDLAQMQDGEQASIESARSLRARFESLGSTPAETPRTPKVKVNRFVEIQTACTDICESCQKKVYPLEKVETNNKIFHKQCFRCLQCNCVLRMDTFTLNNGKLYCIPHFKQLFITRGNYDEGFGVDPHKNKWSSNGNSTSTNPAPIVLNGGAAPVVQQV